MTQFRIGDQVAFSPAYLAPFGIALPALYGRGWVKHLEHLTDTVALATVEIEGHGPIRSFKCGTHRLQRLSEAV